MAYRVAEFVTFAVVVFQFFASLFTGKPNDQLTRFGRNLARYFQQITVYMTFATEEKPFPFTPWPDEPHEEPVVLEDGNHLNDKSEDARDATENDEAGDAEATDNIEDTDKPKD
jgi:hypothetical protein